MEYTRQHTSNTNIGSSVASPRTASSHASAIPVASNASKCTPTLTWSGSLPATARSAPGSRRSRSPPPRWGCAPRGRSPPRWRGGACAAAGRPWAGGGWTPCSLRMSIPRAAVLNLIPGTKGTLQFPEVPPIIAKAVKPGQSDYPPAPPVLQARHHRAENMRRCSNS